MIWKYPLPFIKSKSKYRSNKKNSMYSLLGKLTIISGKILTNSSTKLWGSLLKSTPKKINLKICFWFCHNIWIITIILFIFYFMALWERPNFMLPQVESGWSPPRVSWVKVFRTCVVDAADTVLNSTSTTPEE